MKDYIEKRVLDLSNYIADKRATVRQTAKFFGVSKSTVHKDVTERLPGINRGLAREVKRVLEVNKAERHIRGGEATRKKYQKQPESPMKKGGYSKKT
ncbi:putative DeoR family transcriptional regulator (stage III sporulation protein D) [Hydrogenispora ethanolica]|uniref:Putative DeoR family transcriptional regulator (Stage III sporulation protein D) n=1 Tax=Hydrogenispora ethanolica TaxID=1082276 RepID=A0A4R1S2B6_HYDET|nr:sporulation transcriptional regulator SpoIIID [Hydrogenispora ethanolica]TCL73316.1 putative DeoR family transcriptional regulator (stage III sporulation protein D) [Hydrogenispora ethanolica]